MSPPFPADSEFIADWGAGRFEGASGEMTMHVGFSFPETVVEPIAYIFDEEISTIRLETTFI